MTYYLIDAHTSPVEDSPIIDVLRTNDPFRVDGGFVVQIPDGLVLQEPVDLADLLAKKHSALLRAFPGYANIIYDDLLEVSPSTYVPSGDTSKYGARGTFGWNGDTTWTSAPIDVSPASVEKGVLVWDLYTLHLRDPRNGHIERFYQGITDYPGPSYPGAAFRVSVDGGTNYLTTTSSGTEITFPGPAQGSSFRLQFESVSYPTGWVQLGSWAFMF